MKSYLILSLYCLLFILVPTTAQQYTVTSFDEADIRTSNNDWRELKLSDIKAIRLWSNDVLRVKTGSLFICRCDKPKKLRAAYPGTWTVEQIWKGKALPKTPNAPGPGDTERGLLTISLDFLTESGSFGNTFKVGDSIIGVAISNHGSQDYYAEVLWVDYHANNIDVYRFIFEDPTCLLPEQTVSFYYLKDKEPISNNTFQSAAFVVYSSNPFSLPEIPTLMSERDFVAYIQDAGLKCALRRIEYDYE